MVKKHIHVEKFDNLFEIRTFSPLKSGCDGSILAFTVLTLSTLHKEKIFVK